MALALNAPKAASRGIVGTFIYKGTDAIAEGEPFVQAFDGNGKYLANTIDRPKASGDIFIGVAARDYPADDGSRQIELYLPGSKNVNIKTGAAVTTGGVAQFCFKATTGAKTFTVPSGGSTIARTAAAVGCAIVCQTTDAAGLAAADLCIGPLNAGVSES